MELDTMPSRSRVVCTTPWAAPVTNTDAIDWNGEGHPRPDSVDRHGANPPETLDFPWVAALIAAGKPGWCPDETPPKAEKNPMRPLVLASRQTLFVLYHHQRPKAPISAKHRVQTRAGGLYDHERLYDPGRASSGTGHRCCTAASLHRGKNVISRICLRRYSCSRR